MVSRIQLQFSHVYGFIVHFIIAYFSCTVRPVNSIAQQTPVFTLDHRGIGFYDGIPRGGARSASVQDLRRH